MIRLPALLRPGLIGVSLLLFVCGRLPGADERFTTSPSLATEAKTLVGLLEQAHYNHDAVQSADYAQAIPDYMGALDGQRLLFLATDKAAFMQKFGSSVYFNVGNLGNLDAAYDIFYVYRARAQARITWVFNELAKPVDFTATETYRVDRSKAEWPATPADADDLWHRRLKFELLSEILNKKTPEAAKEAVRKRYERMLKSIAEIDGGDLAEMYLTSIAELYDPHSTYFSADTYEDFGIQMKLQLVGIGALLSIEDDNCVVKEIVPGGPADLSHLLKPNDRILSVGQDGREPVEIIGMKIRKIVDLIRGDKGTRVHLVIQPADATDTSARKAITITRDVVKLNSARARGAVFTVPGADGKSVPLGVITLPAFYGPADDGEAAADKTSASQDVARLLVQLKAQHIQGLVLDLRHNGGGFLTEAIDLTGLFIHPGPVVQVKDYTGQVQVDSEKTEHLAYDGPMAVLVDRWSASASEIVAGALQDYGRAVVIGDRSTHGKGTVQTVVEMKGFPELAHSGAKTGAAKITIQKFYLPDGASTQLKGVIPDIVLPSIDDYIPIGESDLPHALKWDTLPSFFDGTRLDTRVLTPLQKSSLERQQSLEEFAYLRRNVDWFKVRQAQKLVSLNLDERKKEKVADEAFRKETLAEKEKLAKLDFPYTEFRLGPPLPPKIAAAKPAGAGPRHGASAAKSDLYADSASNASLAAKVGGAASPSSGQVAAAGSTKPAAALGPAGANPTDVKAAPDDDADPADEDAADSAENDAYAKVDVPLREALRVLDDAITLGQNRQTWASDHPPLTEAAKG
jgi:carboxyl-terminal processing protease